MRLCGSRGLMGAIRRGGVFGELKDREAGQRRTPRRGGLTAVQAPPRRSISTNTLRMVRSTVRRARAARDTGFAELFSDARRRCPG